MARIVLAEPETGREPFLAFFKDLLVNNHGLMDDLCTRALAMDLRELAPELSTYATKGPEETEGESAHSHGGAFTGLGDNRYHSARHVLALWGETGPATRATLWACFAAMNIYDFSDSSAIAKALRR